MTYDFSMGLSNDRYTYPTDPKIQVKRYLTIGENPSNVSEIHFGSHSGTHTDAPFHFFNSGTAVADIPLSSFYGRTKIAELLVEAGGFIDKEKMQEIIEKSGGEILVLRTGWEANADKPDYFTNFPIVTEKAAQIMADRGIKMFASDLPSVDSASNDFAAHKILLKNGIAIIEGLVNLKSAVGKDVLFFAFPLKLAECDGSPVRALAIDAVDFLEQVHH